MYIHVKIFAVIIPVFILSACVLRGADPEKNIVYYGPGKFIYVHEHFNHIGTAGQPFISEDAYGGILHGRHRIRQENYVKANEENDVTEWLFVKKLRLKTGWVFTGSRDQQEEYGTATVQISGEDRDLYESAIKHGYNFSGTYRFVVFNKEYEKSQAYFMTYGIDASLVPDNLDENKKNQFVKNKAMDSFTIKP